MLAIVYLALGAREGDPRRQLRDGLDLIAGSGIHPIAVSSLWETEPVGIPGVDPVLNAAVGARTAIPPARVLEVCRDAETAAGRRRQAPEWRSLDADVLLYGDLVLSGPDLVLPHPRFHERRFNLAPLAEIAAGTRHPALGLTVAELLRRCQDHSWVRRAESGWWRTQEAVSRR